MRVVHFFIINQFKINWLGWVIIEKSRPGKCAQKTVTLFVVVILAKSLIIEVILFIVFSMIGLDGQF